MSQSFIELHLSAPSPVRVGEAVEVEVALRNVGPRPVWMVGVVPGEAIDSRIADLIDSKAGLAARALDGYDSELEQSMSVQMAALIALLTDALEQRLAA